MSKVHVLNIESAQIRRSKPEKPPPKHPKCWLVHVSEINDEWCFGNQYSIHNEALYLMEMAYQGSNMHQTHARARLEIDISTLSLCLCGVNGWISRNLALILGPSKIARRPPKIPNFPKTSTEMPPKQNQKKKRKEKF